MHLIVNDIKRICQPAADAFCKTYGIPPDRLLETAYIKMMLPQNLHAEYADATDFFVIGHVAQNAKTFLLQTEQVNQFLRAVDRQISPRTIHPPFNEMVIQFSEPIPEAGFLSGVHTSGRESDQGDGIAGLVLAFPDDRGHVINVIAWYASTSVNRVAMDVHSDGEIAYKPIYAGVSDDVAAKAKRDKQRIVNLGLLCLSYITTPGMEVEHVVAPERVNRKRERQGKNILPDYYLCRWVGNKPKGTSSPVKGMGTAHSFRYDVAGHMRVLADGRAVWITAHQRGIEHEQYKPKVYKVE